MGCGVSSFPGRPDIVKCASYAEVSSNLAVAGVEDIQLCVAFDFSSTFAEHTADHACQALSAIAEGLGEKHLKKEILAYGFGDLHAQSHTVFSFHEGQHPCRHLAECVQRFHEIRKAAVPRGQPSLAPLIRETLGRMRKTQRHHVLTIMVQNDIERWMNASNWAMQEACQFGLSIVIIGLGQHDWKGLRSVSTKNVQFVPCPDPAAISEVDFVAKAVEKIPGQYRSGKVRGLPKPGFDCPCYSPPDRSSVGDPWHGLPSDWDAYWDKERDLTVYINTKENKESLLPPVLPGTKSFGVGRVSCERSRKRSKDAHMCHPSTVE
jgi:hypothetical protein